MSVSDPAMFSLGAWAASHPEETQVLVTRALQAHTQARKEEASKEEEDVSGPKKDPDPHEERAGMQPHRCTDVPCCMLFLACLVGFGFVYHYAYTHKDMRKLYSGFDFLGHMCGAGDYEARPFLYYCQKPGLTRMVGGLPVPVLDLQHPLCVSRCPSETNTWTSCYAGHTKEKVITDERTHSFDEIFHYTFQQVPNYHTVPLSGVFCVPLSEEGADELHSHDFFSYAGIRGLARQVFHTWEALVVCVVLGVTCGYLYLWSMQYYVKTLVYACLVVPFVIFTLIGLNLIALSRGWLDWGALVDKAKDNVELPDFDYEKYSSTGSAEMDFYFGIGLTVIGLLFGLTLCCARKSIAIAIGCLEATVECLQQLPTLLLNPLWNVLAQSIVCSLMFVGFAWLVSCGDVESQSLSQYTVMAGGDTDVHGLMRSFKYEEFEYYYLAFYVFMFFWIYEVFVAMSQFVLIYAAELWYFTPYDGSAKSDLPLLPLTAGFRVGVTFHLGSLAFGAFLVALLRCFRILAEILRVNSDEDGEAENKTKRCACACCQACLAFFQKILEYVNKNAYMGVAMHSSGYCKSAFDAVKVLVRGAAAVPILNGVTVVLQFAGVGACASIGFGLEWLILTKVYRYSDPESANYVSKPLPLCAIGAVVSAAAAWVFMLVVDTVSDTILYCYVVDSEVNKGRIKYCPEPLQELINTHSRKKGGS